MNASYLSWITKTQAAYLNLLTTSWGTRKHLVNCFHWYYMYVYYNNKAGQTYKPPLMFSTSKHVCAVWSVGRHDPFNFFFNFTPSLNIYEECDKVSAFSPMHEGSLIIKAFGFHFDFPSNRKTVPGPETFFVK